MIAKGNIQTNLRAIYKLYNSSTSTKGGLFYSKLAILELCGWIEESMDDIVRKCCHRKINDAKVRKDIYDVIKRTYGFEYNQHFRPMLTQVIGRIGVIKLESQLDPTYFLVLRSTLSNLKTYRDSEAHTHLKGITKRLDAPSVTIANFSSVYRGLVDVDNKLRIIGF